MDGFSEKISRDNIHPVTYVKNLVVAQLPSIYGASSLEWTRFDVLLMKIGPNDLGSMSYQL
ncbi:hypothetical protein N0V91_003804 [Didymella pomorum]|uniref:Uncharacterized protein n=1 Tax=Didymella pomorum TaxID=749634 RepID=A0A9W9D8T8_9PLEO|nr:hypothetical protein N0V91_003804 [Didymella pomorum]